MLPLNYTEERISNILWETLLTLDILMTVLKWVTAALAQAYLDACCVIKSKY